MKQTRLLMGMPITLEIVDASATTDAFDTIFDYLTYVDETFSTYKAHSEIMRINTHELALAQASADMRAVFVLAEQTRRETGGYFDMQRDGMYDPSGVVKGWAIANAAAMLVAEGIGELLRRGWRRYSGGRLQCAAASPGGWAFATHSTLMKS